MMYEHQKSIFYHCPKCAVTVMSVDQRDCINLTNMAKARTDAGRAADVIMNWLRAFNTGISRHMGASVQPRFQSGRIQHLKSEAGLHTLALSAKA